MLGVSQARAVVPTDFAKKMTLTPSETALAKIGETAWTDFPVLVRLPAEASALLQSANGTDLLFTDESEAPLAFEVETFNPDGTTFVWVKVPSLSSATRLTVYFGGSENVGNDPTAVWSRYVGVWHFDADAAGTTTVADATGHGLDATTAGDLTAVDGPFGDRCLRSSASTSAPDFESGFAVGATFTASGWFKAPEMTASDYVSPAKKKGSKWDAANGWYLELPKNTGKLQIILKGNTPSTTLSDVRSNWHYFEVVSSGGSVKVYLDGETSPKISSTYTIVANSERYSIQAPKVLSDEYRIRKSAASADETALEYATMADAAFFAMGAIESTDPTAQEFQTPTVVRNADDIYTVTVVLSENSGDVGVIYEGGAVPVTNIVATAANPGTYTDTPANLAADTTYKFAAYGKNANGTEVVKKGGVFYNGDLSITKISDAYENNLVPGVFRISRADTAHEIVVAYTVDGTATPGQTFETLSGTATIPAGATYVDVTVTPINDPTVMEDVMVSITLDAGLYGIDAQAGSAEMTVVNLVAPTGYNTWIATADGLASVDSNWSMGVAPTSLDNVLFDGRFSKANCEWDAAASATVASWTQTNDYTGVITLKTVYPGKGDFQCLTVTGPMAVMSGVITHPQSRTQGQSATDYLRDLLENETYRVRIDAGSLVVGANGRIDALNKGYYHSNSGNHTSPLPSHGGRFSASGQAPYDDVKEPIHIGMPYKRASGTYYIGIGGGAIYLTSTGAIVVDGYIGADTGSDTWNRGYTLRCGAAAGSVYVRGASVTGIGTISASALKTGEQNYRGVGGRVAVIATSSTPIDYTTLQLKATVYPFNNNNGQSTTYGSCGTVFVKDGTQTYGTLLLQNVDGIFAPTIARCTPVIAEGDWTFDAIGLGNRAVLSVPVGTELHLQGGLDSVFSLNAAGSTAYGSIRYEGGTLDLGSLTDQTMTGNWMLTPWSNLVMNANVTVKGGAAIGVPVMADILDDDANGETLPTFVFCNLTITGNLSVESDGFLLAKQCGLKKYKNSLNSGFRGVLPGHTHGGRCLSYKGVDAQLRFYTGYDSVFAPCLPGNAVPWPNGQAAEASGGVIKLVVAGALTLNGEANANGMLEAYKDGGNCSGGTGGSINITAGTISGTGRVVAEAGSKQVVRGSAGRIAVKLTSPGADFSSFSGTISASGRVRGSGGPADSSAGTVYLQTAADGEKGGTVIIAMSEGNRAAGNPNTTEMVSLGYGGDAIADYKKVKYVVRDYGRAAVNADMKAASIEIADSNSSLDLEGHTLVVNSAKVNGVKLASGTYAAGDAEIAGFVVDSATGGALVVTGGGFVLHVR